MNAIVYMKLTVLIELVLCQFFWLACFILQGNLTTKLFHTANHEMALQDQAFKSISCLSQREEIFLNDSTLHSCGKTKHILLCYISPNSCHRKQMESTNAMAWTCQHVINWGKDASQRIIWEHEECMLKRKRRKILWGTSKKAELSQCGEGRWQIKEQHASKITSDRLRTLRCRPFIQ